MLSFMPDELVWVMQREREQEARAVHPHTERQPNGKRSAREQERHNWLGIWVAPSLRIGGNCR